MVKGVSRQVIVVQSPDRKLFEQAIFILRDDASRQGITEEMLLREARQTIRSSKRQLPVASGPIWACGGAMATALVWLLTSIF